MLTVQSPKKTSEGSSALTGYVMGARPGPVFGNASSPAFGGFSSAKPLDPAEAPFGTDGDIMAAGRSLTKQIGDVSTQRLLWGEG